MGNEPLDFVDDEGVQWVMCACGHRAGGGVSVGEKIVLCPNCQLLVRFQSIPVVYPDRLPGDVVDVNDGGRCVLVHPGDVGVSDDGAV